MMKTFSTLVIALAAFAASANAQETKIVSGKVRCTKTSEVTLPEGVKFVMHDYGTRKSLAPVPVRKAAAEEELVTVTVKALGNIEPEEGMIFNKDLKQFVEFENNVATVEVPKGTYDFYVSFYDEVSHYVFKENVSVAQNMELEFDPKESIYPIEFRYYDENNTDLHLEVVDGGNIDTPATADDVIKITSILHKDFGYSMFTMDFGYRSKGYPMDFYVNKLSDKYFIGQSATMGCGSHYYAFKGLVTDCTQGLCKSNPANLIKLSTKIDLSPGMKDYADYVDLPGVEAALMHDGYLLGNTRTWCFRDPADKGNIITYIDCPESTDADPYHLNVAARPVIADGFRWLKSAYGEYEDFAFTVAPLALGNANEGVKYIMSGNDLSDVFNVPVGEDAKYKFYPGHPEFSFASPDGTAHFGTTVPVLSYRSMKIISGNKIKVFDKYSYVGNHGELRETDEKLADVKKKNTDNGTEVTLTNTNIMVDGIPGKNEAVVLYDLNKEDKTAPTFQMLSFKDAEGNINNRFSSTQGARMIFTGGDFTYVDSPKPPYIGYFTCDAPSSVKAYYAPHGTDAWAELTVKEDRDEFFLPYFGHFYEADLSGVKESAWFDVRLEIADAAGNYQKQTIGPAFKVGDATSIAQLSAASANAFYVAGKTVALVDGNDAAITVRSIDGRTLQSVYGRSIDLSGMGSGIYVVTAVASNGNAVSAKVAL